MSDDDVEMTGNRSLDRRTPRFSWNLAYEETFFRSLCESMQLGYKENHSFKAGAWERAAIALRDKHSAFPEKSHLINKADNARKKFRMWRGLREDPDFLYNPSTRTVTASEEAWKRHFEREPLSKALRGRPFEHEEYMEILFPDVVGSGGAPKRIMKPRRRNPDGSLGASSSGRQSTGGGGGVSASGVVTPTPASQHASQHASQPSQAPIDPLLDSNPTPYSETPSRQPNTNSASFHNSNHNGSHTSNNNRPTSTTIPPLSSITPIANISALTPPDEHAPQTSSHSRKRNNPESTPGSRSEKRRGRPSRFSADFYELRQPGNNNNNTTPSQSQMKSQTSAFQSKSPAMPPPRHSNNNTGKTPDNPPPASANIIHSSFHPNGLSIEDVLLSLADAFRTRAPPKWQEQAVEILFRDFEAEDPDLQLKIAEKALTDENKAMVFVKMTPALRKHWVGRLREVHQRNLGGGLGRVGEEAS